jgi:hypothetical protein
MPALVVYVVTDDLQMSLFQQAEPFSPEADFRP